jgi:1-acyl-sn-glycerol-3-phosphate acyltransferase
LKTTIFNTPALSPLLRQLARGLLRLSGWRVDGGLPDLPRFVLIGAPHTSNWDFLLFLGVIFYLRADVHFMGKAEIFRPPFGAFFRWCGGVPVDRAKSSGLVEQMTLAFRESERFILVIAPEGTRHRVQEWKSGFYHIARSAGVPIVLAGVDGPGRTVRIGQIFNPTQDMEADMKAIKGYFAGALGIRPHRKSGA